jgi:hypothetical protein
LTKVQSDAHSIEPADESDGYEALMTMKVKEQRGVHGTNLQTQI